MMDALDHVLKNADKYGITAVLVFVGIYIIVRIARWFGAEFIVPIRDAMIGYLADMKEWNRSLGKTVDGIRRDYENHHAWEKERADSTDEKIDRVLDVVTKRPNSRPA